MRSFGEATQYVKCSAIGADSRMKVRHSNAILVDKAEDCLGERLSSKTIKGDLPQTLVDGPAQTEWTTCLLVPWCTGALG